MANNVYGIPAFRRDLDRTDQIGVRQLVLSKAWGVPKDYMQIDEEDALVPAAPPTPKGMLWVGRETKPERGAYRTLWTYKGIHSDGKNVAIRTRANSFDFQFKPGFAQVTIARHPKLQAFLDQYEGYYQDGQIHFPPLLSNGKTNPLFGQTDFFRIQGTYTYRYIARSLAEVPAREGQIFEAGSLPGQARVVPGCNYLCAGVPYQCLGQYFEVMEIYWMSGLGGWPKQIYGGGVNAGAADDPTPSLINGLAGSSAGDGGSAFETGEEFGPTAFDFLSSHDTGPTFQEFVGAIAFDEFNSITDAAGAAMNAIGTDSSRA